MMIVKEEILNKALLLLNLETFCFHLFPGICRPLHIRHTIGISQQDIECLPQLLRCLRIIPHPPPTKYSYRTKLVKGHSAFKYCTLTMPLERQHSHVGLLYVRMTVHRENLRTNNQQDASSIQNFILSRNSTRFGHLLCPSSGVISCTRGNCHVHS